IVSTLTPDRDATCPILRASIRMRLALDSGADSRLDNARMKLAALRMWSVVVLALAGASCSGGAQTSAPRSEAAACCLDALSDADRAREHELLREHVRAVQEVRELPDGYAY